jgi:hypothetical protein
MVERSACSCPMWKPTSHTMVAKMPRISSWVLMHLLWWLQRKKWIPMEWKGSVHTHIEGILPIEGWGSPNCVWSNVKKIGEDNWKVRKTGWVVSQALAPRPKHDKIRTQWALDIVVEHVGKSNMVQTFWNGILKLNHLLPNELFKWKETYMN